jgi:hypothetical protein
MGSLFPSSVAVHYRDLNRQRQTEPSAYFTTLYISGPHCNQISNNEECCLLACVGVLWLFVRIDVSEEHIASILRAKELSLLVARSDDVPHDGGMIEALCFSETPFLTKDNTAKPYPRYNILHCLRREHITSYNYPKLCTINKSVLREQANYFPYITTLQAI